MRAADALMKSLAAEDVEAIFGIPGGANLPTYDALVDADGVQTQAAPDVKLVVPGEPERSYLLAKMRGAQSQLVGGGAGARMPIGAEPRPDDELELVARWIACGALESPD